MKYICNDCGEIFDEPITLKEDRGEFWGFPAYEYISGCPACKSDAIEEYNESEDET